MKMTPRNIALMIVALIVGVLAGFQWSMIGFLGLGISLVFVTFILLRNKSGKLASSEATADAMEMNIPQDQCRIYVMRKGFVGGQQGMDVTIDDGLLNSQIRSKYFLMADLPPGKHDVVVQMSSGTKGSAQTHSVELDAGQMVLLDVKLDVGLVQGKPTFDEVRDPSAARSRLEDCRLVEWKAVEDAQSPTSA